MTSWRWPNSACASASASSEAIRSSTVSPMPTRIPLVNGTLSSPAALIVASPPAGCYLGVDLGLLARQHEQLLRAAPRRLVEQPLDLVGRVQVRPVRRERAVLAVAPARPREREREVARERDPAHRPEST